MTYIIRFEDKEKESLMGGKARAIAQLQQQAGFLIPNGFVLSPAAFEASLTLELREAIVETFHEMPLQQDEDEIQRLLANLQLNETVKLEMLYTLHRLCPNGELVAVRSSAIDEDNVQHSFAGQLDSFLNVPLEEVAEKVAAVWRSNFSDRVLNYRRELGLSPIPHPPAVLIQRMVNPTVAGVAFAADPVTGRRGVAVISAVSGLGTSLVSGETDADTYHVDLKERIIQRQIIAEKPILDDEQIQAVAKLVRQVSKYFDRPQDIEWAIEDGQVYLLQSRPITTLAQMPDPDGIFNLWDNSNIAESYSGVTTPLTFSFARRAYEQVYRQFCRLMGVPLATINRHDDTFSRMIGLIQGRVYYNLLSWYRVLALLPGFRVNRRFMEQMMGVRESLPESIVAELQTATWQDRLQDSWRLVKTVVGLITNYFLLPRRIRQFYQRLDKALQLSQFNLEDLRPDELAAFYRQIESQLLTRWDAPLINDFFAMIFYGVLRSLTEKWCNDKSRTLQNDLIGGEGNIISAEPAKRIREMAGLIAGNREVIELLCHGSLDAILPAIAQLTELKLQYQEYLEKFGDRCLEELKLESPTLHDNPLPLLRAVGQLAGIERVGENSLTEIPNPKSQIQIRFRKTAELRLRRAFRGHPLRRLVFNWVLKNARKRVRDRENLRFERTRVFGLARRVFLEFGRRFYALDLLQSHRDIFYLEVNEIMGFIEGTATCTDLKGLVAVRQGEFAKYREMPSPSDRFETRGIVYQGLEPPPSTGGTKGGVSQSPITSSYLQGIGCSPGVVRGAVRVITDPRQVVGTDQSVPLQPGTIIVADRTDPGWILLFPAAAGLLVERGSLLSHAAIVARELGIPAIVSLPGVTQWLKDGDWVELDGSTGKVSKIS
ncbi:PEP/pyruvate-binding domain-containing protein [Argonema antarcticum]|uniref:PEP/pyruvate-binding domain-containing protein n=1 Tax=Argonema antarcticum TaxID=2942763 RepID=UPI0020122214|nr:PEP/pyruvate-binding domain-containing protein [Argonema antarcticum]MCL1470392.1 phosphoenolpyruvate synthase [Argonema antarcticum A004/B2]